MNTMTSATAQQNTITPATITPVTPVTSTVVAPAEAIAPATVIPATVIPAPVIQTPVISATTDVVNVSADEPAQAGRSTRRAAVENELAGFELLSQKNLRSGLTLIYGEADKENQEDLISGLTALYRVPHAADKFNSLEVLKQQITAPDKADETIAGWHAMHFCLACLSGEALVKYASIVMGSYQDEEWGKLNRLVNGTMGLLHMLAMNPDKVTALEVYRAFVQYNAAPECLEGGYLGLLPTHIAVLNGAYELAEAMGRDYANKCSLSCIPVSVDSLKNILVENRGLTQRDLISYEGADSSKCGTGKLRLVYTALKATEIVSNDGLSKFLLKTEGRGITCLQKVQKGSRISSVWLKGLMLPMSVNLCSWNRLHLKMVSASCSVASLDELVTEEPQLLSYKDSLGRSPLFYGLACGSVEVIKWCLNLLKENTHLQKEKDCHNRSLLTALAMNPNADEVSGIVGDFICATGLEEDIFELSPVIYAQIAKNDEMAKAIYKIMNRCGLEGKDFRNEQWEKALVVAKQMNNSAMTTYLKENSPIQDHETCGFFGFLYN